MNNLILLYLKKKGLTSTASQFSKELQSIGNSDAENGTTRPPVYATSCAELALAEDIVSSGISNMYIEPDVISEYYSIFESWASNSLDLIRKDVFALCFPIFVHSYIGMVRHGRVDAARCFADRWGTGFLHLYREQMQSLLLLNSADQLTDKVFLTGNTFVKCALCGRFQMIIQELSLVTLQHFLVENFPVMMPIITILNERLHLKTISLSDASPDNYAPEVSEGGIKALLEGYNTSSVRRPSLGAHYTSCVFPYDCWPDGEVNKGVKESSSIHSNFRKLDQVTAQSVIKMLSNSRQCSRVGGKSNTAPAPPLAAAQLGVPGKACRKDLSHPLTYPDSNDVFYNELLTKLITPQLYLTAVGQKRKRLLANDAPPNNTFRLHPLEKEEEGANTESKVNGDPSIVMVTIAPTLSNVEGSAGRCGGTASLISMDMTNDCRVIVGGFDDSVVRVWSNTQGGSVDECGDAGNAEPSFGRYSSAIDTTLPHPRGALPTHANPTPTCIELIGHSQPVYGVSVDNFSNHSSGLLASCSSDSTVRLWNTTVSRCVEKVVCTSPCWDVQFGPLGYYYATANQDRNAYVYATDRLTPLRAMTSHTSSGHVSDVTKVVWHPNAMYIATGSDDSTCRLWDIRGLRSGSFMTREFKDRHCGSHAVTSMTISPCGSYLAVGSEVGNIFVWDMSVNSRLLRVLSPAGAQPVYSLSFSDNGQVLSSGGADCVVSNWDMTVHADDTNVTVQDTPTQLYHTKHTPVYHIHRIENTKTPIMCVGGPF